MITFSQGDAITLNLTAVDGNNSPINLNGASFQTQIRGPQGALVTIGNSAHTANSDQVNFKGQFTVALTSLNTKACDVGSPKDIVTQVTLSGSPIYYHGVGVLQVLQPFPQR